MEREIFKKYIDNSCNGLPPEQIDDWDNDYLVEAIKCDYKTFDIDGGMIVWIEKDCWAEFFVFEVSASWVDDKQKEHSVADIVWHGNGTLGSLRELRHSYFNPYLFYINAKLIEASFKELRKHFDI